MNFLDEIMQSLLGGGQRGLENQQGIDGRSSF